MIFYLITAIFSVILHSQRYSSDIFLYFNFSSKKKTCKQMHTDALYSEIAFLLSTVLLTIEATRASSLK